MTTKRPVKFRGKTCYGTSYYGGFFQNELGHCYIITDENLYYGSLNYHKVEPDSVAQLVGYDANGDEVYEGDVLINCFHDEGKARLTGEVEYLDCNGRHNLNNESFRFILVE